MNELIIGTSDLKRKEYTEKKISKLLLDPEKRITVILPEQYTYETERRFLEMFGEDSMRRISVVSFKTLRKNVFAKTGALRYNFIGEGGKNALLMKAVSQVSPFLKYYPENIRSFPFISLVNRAIKEMKTNGITPDMLKKTAEIEDSDKLRDISLFASSYQALLTNGMFDPDDDLTVLSKEIELSRLYKGTSVICDRFSYLLAPEADVIMALAASGAEISVSFPAPSLNEPKYSLFSFVSRKASAFRAKAQKYGIGFDIIYLGTDRGMTKDLEAVADSIYTEEVSDAVPENISVYKASDIVDEAERAAAKIAEMVRDKGYRYSDFVVITRENEPYSTVFEPAFAKYGVPLFCHRRVPLRIKPLCALIDALFSIICDGYRREHVLSFLKTGLTEPSDDDVSAFESYIAKWRISYDSFLKEFRLPAEDYDQELLSRINGVRKYLTEKVEGFRRSAAGGNVRSIAEALFGFFCSISLKEALDEAGKDYSDYGEDALLSEQNQIYDLIIDALDELVTAAGDDEVSPDEFRNLLFSVIEENDIGIIPTALNEVIAGNIESVPLNMPKVAFVLGLSDGSFPRTDTGFSLFDDSDRMMFEKYDIELGRTEEDELVNEQYLVYRAMSAPTEKLFVSYSESDSGQARPSSAITELHRIFPSLKDDAPLSANNPDAVAERIQNEESAFDAYARFGSEKIRNYLADTGYGRFLNTSEQTWLSKDTASLLFGKNMRLSASRVAKYYECGFSYFCEYGLGLRSKRDNLLGALETGNYMHYILEHAFAEGLGTDEQIKALAERLSSEYLDGLFGQTPPPSGFMTYYRRLIQKSTRLLIMFRDELEQSKFVPVDFEVEISDSGKVKPVVIPVEDGSICLVGKADRVDIFEKDGRKYMRIVDYKSGTKSFDLQYVYYGLDVQMLMYLCALNENGRPVFGNTMPAGCMYVGANPKIVSIEKGGGLTEEENELWKKHPRSGIFLDDNAVLNAMDDGLGGRYIPVKTNSQKKPLVTEEEFGKLFFHIKKLLENMAQTLLSGNTLKNPVKTRKKDSCEYCVFRPYCFYEGHGRKMESIGIDNIFRKIDEEK